MPKICQNFARLLPTPLHILMHVASAALTKGAEKMSAFAKQAINLVLTAAVLLRVLSLHQLKLNKESLAA
jgi:hypothetical protein